MNVKYLLRSENSGQQIVGLGLENIVAVATRDAVLVVDKNKTQDVRNVVDFLIDRGLQANEFTKDFRPWGWFERLEARFQVKQTGKARVFKLQSHKYRSEHWIVIEGVGKVTIGEVEILHPGQSAYIPVGRA